MMRNHSSWWRPALKITTGLGFFSGAAFAWWSLVWGSLWFTCVAWVLVLGLASTGLFLILKRRAVVSKSAKVLVGVSASLLVLTPLIAWVHIGHESRILQVRAKTFLQRPVPVVFKGDAQGSVGLHQVGPGEDGLKNAHALVKRYADKGRIRWSARIQAEFAVAGLEIATCEDLDVIGGNEEARRYVEDCKAILEDEWRMGYWHYIDDWVEGRRTIPEYDEEDIHTFVH